jgi:hypothetical protein
MKQTARRFIILGVLMFLLSGVFFVIAVAGASSAEPAQKVLHVSLLTMLLAVGLMITSGLLCVAGAVLTLAERLPPATERAEPTPDADRPRDQGSTNITERPA